MKTLLLSSAAITGLVLAPAYAQDATTPAADDVPAMGTDANADAPDAYFGDLPTQTDTPVRDVTAPQDDAERMMGSQDADEGAYEPSFGEATDTDRDADTDLASDDAAMPMDDGAEMSAESLNSQQMQAPDVQPRATVASTDDGRVVVTITGVQPDGGDVFVALQDEQGFANAAGQYVQTREANGDTVEVIFDSVATGEYAVAAFQDTDEDDSLTLGQAGPTEPWGFSGDVSGVPSFDDAAMQVSGDMDARVQLMGSDERVAMNEQRGDRMAMGDQPATQDRPRAAGTLSGQPTPGIAPAPEELALVYRNSASLTPTAVTAKDFLDGELVSSEGEELAEVKDVIIDQDGQARGIILATGGLFGLGRDYYAVDFDRVLAVRMDDGEVELQSALTEEDVERLREFDLDAFEADMGSLMLASELREQRLPIGQTEEAVTVDDVIMSRSGTVEALVVDYDGDSFVAPFAELGVAQGDGGFFIDTTPELIGAMAVYEGRGGMQTPR